MSQNNSINNEETIYEQIFNAILTQRLAPATRLREEHLSEIFDTNRRIIRRVLKRLSYEGIVTIKAHKGAEVMRPSLEHAQQIFTARMALERIILEECINNSSPEIIARLRCCVEQENEAYQNQNKLDWIRLSGEFHIQIAKASLNPLYIKFMKEMVAHTSLIISLYGYSTQSLCKNHDHHHIVNAIEDKDLDKATELMNSHLQECFHTIDQPIDHDQSNLHEIFNAVS